MKTAAAKRKLPEGWMGKTSRKWLREMAGRYSRIIEVGSWLGRSTKVLAKATAGNVWAVDTWAGTPADPKQHELYAELLETRDAYAEFRVNLSKEIRRGIVKPIRMPSVEAAAYLRDAHGAASFDFVFIDADHGYEGCRGDIAAYLPLVQPGGLLAGHDYHWPGVKQAVDEAFGERAIVGPRSLWSVAI